MGKPMHERVQLVAIRERTEVGKNKRLQTVYDCIHRDHEALKGIDLSKGVVIELNTDWGRLPKILAIKLPLADVVSRLEKANETDNVIKLHQ